MKKGGIKEYKIDTSAQDNFKELIRRTENNEVSISKDMVPYNETDNGYYSCPKCGGQQYSSSHEIGDTYECDCGCIITFTE